MDELLDIYDGDKRFTGRTHPRRQPRADGDFCLVALAVVRNSEWLHLITKRDQKSYLPGLWENAGGAATAGESSLETAVREFREETGFLLRPEKGSLLLTRKAESPGLNCFMDVWLFESDFDINRFVPQEGETVAAKWASREEILKLHDRGEFVPFSETGLDKYYSLSK